ncbi:hypothetical protein LENED_005951 [Lentinula edodes]|uniref:Uncharacterized protein n=1 Tax=Lentinula edodes TaxID=5353 RepID=A0A1Q3EAD1_LENED|nr:hypothetical protein LENED_005951 [Lentinula edodes]
MHIRDRSKSFFWSAAWSEWKPVTRFQKIRASSLEHIPLSKTIFNPRKNWSFWFHSSSYTYLSCLGPKRLFQIVTLMLHLPP